MDRRQFLASLPLFGGLTGCTQRSADYTRSTPSTSSETSTTETATEAVRIRELRVADFIHYPLSGTHPHVHRQADTQYVAVRVDSHFDDGPVRQRLSLELDGEPVPLSNRQPVSWEHDTADLAFAVSKEVSVTDGQVLFDGATVQSLSDATIDRLNEPPMFEVSTPSVSPAELDTTEVTDITVRFTLSNTGSGAGTFGASLVTNFLSGSQTVTAMVAPGEKREVTMSDKVRPTQDGATVRLDWGLGRVGNDHSRHRRIDDDGNAHRDPHVEDSSCRTDASKLLWNRLRPCFAPECRTHSETPVDSSLHSSSLELPPSCA